MNKYCLTFLCVLLAFIVLSKNTFAEEPIIDLEKAKEAVDKHIMQKEQKTGVAVFLKRKLSRSHKCPVCGHVDRESDSLFWLVIGFIGQLVFTSRFVVQWIKSERRKESYIPHIFWYLSIAGSVLLLSYAISIEAWPIIFGQAFGVIVYGRNLALIARSKNAAALNEPSDNNSAENIRN